MNRSLLAGLAAGAAGTAALDLVTYLDMVVRARPASSTPEQTVRKVEELTGLPLSADGPDSDAAQARRSGLGALLGIVAGLAVGALYGLVRPRLDGVPLAALGVGVGLAANVGTTGPMAALGVTDPRRWPASSWVSDLVPHLAYGAVTATVYELARPGAAWRRWR
jgi:xanthosine utilization system XapX-like protein